MFLHIVESGCYICINVSETHSDNCGKHAQNTILILIGQGFLTCLGLGGRPSIFVSEPITKKFCTVIDHQSVSLNTKKVCIKVMTSYR